MKLTDPLSWDTNHLAPRAGFAWSGLKRTVIRGGAGAFFAPFSFTTSDTGFIPTTGYNSARPNQVGQINSSTGNPRVMQMAMKVLF